MTVDGGRPDHLVPRADVAIEPVGPVQGELGAPGSKSMTNRLLILGALAEGRSVLRDPLSSDDSAAMRGVVEALGATVEDRADGWLMGGTGGRLTPRRAEVDAALSGTTMRFGAAFAALAPEPVRVTGGAPLLARPVGPLVAALRQLGAHIEDTDGFPPVTAGGDGLEGGRVVIDVSGSTQFASAVLLVAPYARTDVEVVTTGAGATDYITLTVEAMRAWGAQVTEIGDGAWRVAAGHPYREQVVTVEHDASAAAHLYGLAAATGGQVTVINAGDPTQQPDAHLPEVLARMGCEVTVGRGVTVRGPKRLRAVDVDLSEMPDQVTTVGALAALADGVTEIRGAAVARKHETDRLAALATELGKLGVEVTERPDGLRIVGGTAQGPARLATYDDHRLAMAFAAIGARVPGVVVAEPWCVTKTYPCFWSDIARLGVEWREVRA